MTYGVVCAIICHTIYHDVMVNIWISSEVIGDTMPNIHICLYLKLWLGVSIDPGLCFCFDPYPYPFLYPFLYPYPYSCIVYIEKMTIITSWWTP